MEENKSLDRIRNKNIKDINTEDIRIVLKIISNFISKSPETRKLIDECEAKGLLKISDLDYYHIIIDNKTVKFNQGKLENPDFFISSDMGTIAKLFLGYLNPLEAYFSGVLSITGDKYKVVVFIELLEHILRLLELDTRKDEEALITTRSMRKLMEIYLKGGSEVETSQIPLFLEILALFVNTNPEAKNVILDEELKIHINIIDDEDYTILITNNLMEWHKGIEQETDLLLEMSLKTSVKILINGDAVSAFMDGSLKIEGDFSRAIAFQNLVEIFLDFVDINL